MDTLNKRTNKGKVYLVGAGPGDPDLLTVKALKTLRKADIVFYDDLVSPRILGVCRKKIQMVYVGKRLGIHSCLQDEINTKLIQAANEYKTVVRLKGGDPSIFGRVGEEYSSLISTGISCEIIAGITTASGVASSLGFPLTHRDYAREILFLSGHKKDGVNSDSFKNLNCVGKTIIVYMGLNSIDLIVSELLDAGNSRETHIAVIQNATLNTERVFTGNLDSIQSIILENQVKSPAILVIGEIVRFYREMEILKNDYSSILTSL
ncbi:uroporphyrinogen-III C-methyltransferase [Leptospira meyeri]|uniref:uroporphyrinogen-III C-methyltransferase n=1 Tax=Leptospira meyeri TaxID=29508 RepID=UPI000C2B46E0|nr:uroporphyrinogen-III C-methyltransferase [Leptospira meyeri]PKA26365.1 uroporphyrinogen-III C-methyltransferase [Leptospira sp. mixed culture ATI2-C-A1]MCW7487729.1 uroporphyrinogen-III C-methyltransferase [Leptospira meyeri]TGL13561.1 uroporphyrinogen-III C-methyltransferase [Leptospira meyeri]TGM17597.1 uroporphyrinogen-III C-methyltransferase [Leptospira meyeri]TGM63239.1 uroporphyrinogen-III C-methyltransferase [Leptospira meyeri]